MFQHSLQAGQLPKTMQLATIKVIPKEQKDPESPSSHRPLSIQELSRATFRQLKFKTTDGFEAMHFEYSVVGPLTAV